LDYKHTKLIILTLTNLAFLRFDYNPSVQDKTTLPIVTRHADSQISLCEWGCSLSFASQTSPDEYLKTVRNIRQSHLLVSPQTFGCSIVELPDPI